MTRSASAADIKSAFRKLAKKHHPDANKSDPKAAARFAEVNAAYEIVGDKAKRKAFDNGEIDAEGKPRFQGFEGFARQGGAGRGAGGGFGGDSRFETFTWGPEGAQASGGAGARGFGGFEDILKDVFGARAGARGARPGGFNSFETEDFGAVPGRDIAASLEISLAEAAKGVKKRVQLPNGKDVEVKIPAGLDEGQQIRLKGQGQTGAGGQTGDLLITVTFAPHPPFHRDGVDLRLDLPITLYEAVLGSKVRVPTLDGAVELAIPAGTNAGRTFRLRGKGYPGKERKGDLLATVRIVLPDGQDPDLEELMRKWRDSKPYDPRKDMA